jgi:hypothetical protein
MVKKWKFVVLYYKLTEQWIWETCQSIRSLRIFFKYIDTYYSPYKWIHLNEKKERCIASVIDVTVVIYEHNTAKNSHIYCELCAELFHKAISDTDNKPQGDTVHKGIGNCFCENILFSWPLFGCVCIKHRDSVLVLFHHPETIFSHFPTSLTI